MNTVRRTRGIRKIIRRIICGGNVQKYVTAGEKNCGKMMREARAGREHSGPSDQAILTWAEFDLIRERLSGFWESEHHKTQGGIFPGWTFLRAG